MANIINGCNSRESFKNLLKIHKNKIIIVKASATWCRPCKQIIPIVKKLFDALPQNKLLVKIDVDNDDDVSAYLKIRSLPTLLLYVKGEKQEVVIGCNEKNIINFFNKCKSYCDLNFDGSF